MPRRNDAASVGEVRCSWASELGSAGTSAADDGADSSSDERKTPAERRREMKPVRPMMSVGGLPYAGY